MNLYERLKVTQDAPPEVIRAAYRALAQTVVPDDASREAQVMALNEAYETLIDPQARVAYDATLRVVTPDIVLDEAMPSMATSPAVDMAGGNPDLAPDAWAVPGADAAAGTPAPDDDVVDPWQAVYDAPPWERPRPWSRQPLVWVGAALVLLMAAGAGVWTWQFYATNRLVQGIAVQVEQGASGAPLSAPPAMPRPAGEADRAPSVDELARMSDEELLKVLPTLDEPKTSGAAPGLPSVATPPANRSAFAGRHPLDGTPLRLRTEGDLVDPLAPEPAPPSGSHKP